MEYITDTKDFMFENTVIALGKFDGLHKGHRKLLQVLEEEKENSLLSVVFTFDNSPKKLISGEKPGYLLTREEKRIFHEMCGIDVLIEYPFDEETAKMSPEYFVREILKKKLGIRKLVCGTDFRFGHNREGDTGLLKKLGDELGFEVAALEKEQYELRDISSTLIKEELLLGNMETVNEMLGYPFTVIGEVVYGNQIGRTIGAPTLNLLPHDSKLLPPNGVYSTMTIVDGKKYPGITNIGYKPTVSKELLRGVETHLFDYEGNLYGKIIEVQFFKFVRKEVKFTTLENLKEQILRDIKTCKSFVNR